MRILGAYNKYVTEILILRNEAMDSKIHSKRGISLGFAEALRAECKRISNT